MKTLKFYLVLVLMGLCCISCSKDDSSGGEDLSLDEKIVGKWQFDEIIDSDGELVDMGVCISQSTYEFKENGNWILTFVRPDEFNEEECDVGTTNGEWEYVADNNFKITSNEESVLQEIQFSENYTRISITSDDSLDKISLIKIANP